MLRNFKVVLSVLILLAIAGSAYTVATHNRIAKSSTSNQPNGDSSYTVTNVVYAINAGNPNVVDAIRFEITPNDGAAVAASVKVQTANDGAWTDCTLAAGTPPIKAVTCTYGSLTLDDVTALNILASSMDPVQ